jgi:hypothetical protein
MPAMSRRFRRLVILLGRGLCCSTTGILQTIDAQADLIASLEARCAKYAFDQAALIVEGNREAHKR